MLASGAGASAALRPPPADDPKRLAYWRQLWQNKGDVFTLPEVNENLARFKSELLPPPAREAATAAASARPLPPRVLVPLCGRSVDLNYLAEEGCFVVGVEAVGEPLRQWGNEYGGLEPIVAEGDATAYRSRWYPRLVLMHADFFRLSPDALGGPFDAVWDRGGMTSIEEGPRRAAYVAALAGHLRPGGKLLLEFLSCNLAIDGAMTSAEAAVAMLTGAGFVGVRSLARRDVRSAYPGFSPPGLAYLEENVLLATAPRDGGPADAGGAEGAKGEQMR
jgi:thiopurine S-methyltransferase